MYMLVRNLQKKGDYQKSLIAQDENLRLAIQNDQNVANARKTQKAGMMPALTAKQSRFSEQVLTDALEIKVVAMNNLRSIFSEEQAKKFLNGDGRTNPLTQDDMEYLNIFWEDLKPVLQSKTGLTLKFFRDILKKSTAGRRANYGFYTGRTTPAKSSVINTTEELLKTVPPIDMLRAANKKAATIGQTIPEGASLTKDLSTLIGNFPTSGDKRLLKLEKIPPENKMDFYRRFQKVFEGYEPDVEKWKKANMKDDLDFINDIRNLIPDMTNFERDVKQLYEDLMAAREAITLEPPPTAEGKDDLQEPLPDIKGEVIQQDAKETLPTLPDEPKPASAMVEFKVDDDEPVEGETTLDALTRRISRQSGDITALLEGEERLKAEERNAKLDRLTRQSKADLEQALAEVGGYEPPEIIEPRLDRSGLNVDEVSWAKALNFLEIERRKQDSVDRAIERNRDIQEKREQQLRELAKSVVSLQKKRKATVDQDAEIQRLQLQQQFDKEQEQELILLQKGRLSQMDIDLGQALDRLYDDVSERLDMLNDRLAQKQNAVLAVKVGKARKKEEKELRQLEEEQKKEEQKLLDVDKRREELMKRLITLEESPIELPPKLTRSVAFNPKVGTLKEEQIRLRQRLDELGDPAIRFLLDRKSKRAQKMEDDAYNRVNEEYRRVTKEIEVIEENAYRAETETKIQEDKATADQLLSDIRAMPTELIEDKRAKAKALQQWLFSPLVRNPPALSQFRNSRFKLQADQKYPPLYTDKELQAIKNEEGRLEEDVRNKDKANEQAIGSLNYIRGKAFNKQNMDNLDKAWVELGKNKTDLELVEFKEALRQRFNPKDWANEIEDFIQAEKDRQAMEELGIDLGEQKRTFERAVAESVVLEDLVKRSALKNLGDLTETQLEDFFKQTANDSVEERATRLSGETPPATPPKRRPTPSRPRLSSRQPSMEVISEIPEPKPSPRRPTPIKGRMPTPSKLRPASPKAEFVEPTGVNPLIVEKEQLTEQELTDQLEALKRKKPRQEIDKRARKNEMDAIQNVLGRKAFKETTPIDVLEQRMKSEGTAPKRPLPTPRPARTPEQRRQAAEKAAELEAPTTRVPTPLRRAPSPSVRLDTPTKSRVPVKTTFQKMTEQPIEALVKKAEAIMPEVEKLARKRPTPVKALPAEEREGDREMADALRRRARRDPIREQAQADAELFLAKSLVKSGVDNESVNALEKLIEQKKNEGFTQGTITAKKAQRSPYRPSENIAKFQSVQAELPETPVPSSRVETLLASRVSRVSDAQERLRLEEEQRRMRLARELEAQQLKPNEEAKRLMEERRSSTPLSRPETPLRTKTPVQRLIQARQLVRDFESMKAELDAGVPDKDAVYADERERYKNGTKTLNLWNSMNLTPDEQQLLGTSKDDFLGKWADAVRKAGKGIPMKPKTFVEFGKFKLNENMLEEGTLQVKTANGSPVPAFSKKIAISDTLQSILMDLIETKKLRGVSDLDDEERRLIETLIIKAGLAYGLGVKKVHQSDEDAEKVKRFDLVKGIYDAGNNSMEVIHELRSLILYFIKTKRLDRKAGIQALQELQ